MAGWSTWYATGGNLSEAVVLDVAERMVQTGLRDAGYVFVSPAAGKPRGRVALRVGSLWTSGDLGRGGLTTWPRLLVAQGTASGAWLPVRS